MLNWTSPAFLVTISGAVKILAGLGMGKSVLFLGFSLLALNACVSEYQYCLHRVGAEVSRLQNAIFETEANLKRGFALRKSVIADASGGNCVPTATTGPCLQIGFLAEDRPVAIDPEAERARLSHLKLDLAAAKSLQRENLASCEGLEGS